MIRWVFMPWKQGCFHKITLRTLSTMILPIRCSSVQLSIIVSMSFCNIIFQLHYTNLSSSRSGFRISLNDLGWYSSFVLFVYHSKFIV